MNFENLRVGRVIVHEIFQRMEDRQLQAPSLGRNLERLEAEALAAFEHRLTDALVGQAQSLEMAIRSVGEGSLLRFLEKMLHAEEAAFVEMSGSVAGRLADAQLSRRIPGGMVVLFQGTITAASVPFLGIIKAETQTGFRRSTKDNRSTVEFLKNLFLTPATRLYKVGVFVFNDVTRPPPEGRRAFIFDSNISLKNREAAAAYFYEGFLGCSLPSDGPYETMRFFDLTKEFVRKSALDAERKRDLIDCLHVFVRDELHPTFTTDNFAETYLPEDMRDPYVAFLESKQLRAGAIVRDTSLMGNRLKRRRFQFGADVELIASPDALSDRVALECIPSEEDASKRWTRITIKAPLTGEQ